MNRVLIERVSAPLVFRCGEKSPRFLESFQCVVRCGALKFLQGVTYGVDILAGKRAVKITRLVGVATGPRF